MLDQRVRYEERGPAVTNEVEQAPARKMIRELRSLGYRSDRVATARVILEPGSSKTA
jgi:hypothetical protein